jgi:uncharacterized membrane protein YhaH (DUF805 family)
MHWLIDPIKFHYFDFSGRATRKEYWMFQFLIAVLYLVTFLLGILLQLDRTLSLAVVIFMVGFFILPCISIQVRRFHDVGYSGWWVLITLFPYVGALFSFCICCWSSQTGTNSYGVNKYGIEAPTAHAD